MPRRCREALPYLPLLAWCLTSTGTVRTDETRMEHLLCMHTGGVGAAPRVIDVMPRAGAVATRAATYLAVASA